MSLSAGLSQCHYKLISFTALAIRKTTNHRKKLGCANDMYYDISRLVTLSSESAEHVERLADGGVPEKPVDAE